VLLPQGGLQVLDQRRPAGFFHSKRLGQGDGDQIGIADRSEIDEPDAVGECVEQLGGDLEA
jgi:hypothetical protein